MNQAELSHCKALTDIDGDEAQQRAALTAHYTYGGSLSPRNTEPQGRVCKKKLLFSHCELVTVVTFWPVNPASLFNHLQQYSMSLK